MLFYSYEHSPDTLPLSMLSKYKISDLEEVDAKKIDWERESSVGNFNHMGGAEMVCSLLISLKLFPMKS